MVTKRRSPGALPPKLTPQQKADAERCYPIARRVASHFARRRPAGLAQTDLLSAANEAVVHAVSAHDPSKGPVENFVWAWVHLTMKGLIRKKATELGPSSSGDTRDAQVARAGSEGLHDFARAVADTAHVWDDSHEDFVRQYADVGADGATAWAVGGAGHLWHMRGDEGLALRAEYVRGMKLLHDEVAKLKPAHATIMELRFFRELTVEEVAKAAGVSVPTVTRTMGEAIPTLRARLEARGIKDLSLLEGR